MIVWPNCDVCEKVAEYEVRTRPRKVLGFWRADEIMRVCEDHFINWSREAIIEYNKRMKITV